MSLYQQALQEYQQGHLEIAHDLSGTYIKQNPLDSQAWYLLSLIYVDLNRLQFAASALNQAIKINPQEVDYWLNMGAIFQKQAQYGNALKYYKRVLELNPNIPEVHKNIGQLFEANKQLDVAVESYKKAIKLKPNFMTAHYHLAGVLAKQDNITEAIRYYQQVFKFEPEYSEAHSNLALIYFQGGQSQMAHQHFFRALKTMTDYLTIDKQLNLYSMVLFHLITFPLTTKKEFFSIAKNWSTVRKERSMPDFSFQPSHDSEKRLKIGYISGDFYHHSTSAVFKCLFDYRNRETMELYAFSNGLKQDVLTEEYRQSSDHWFEVIKLSDQELAQLVYEQQIDILVDLSGHTLGNRLDTFLYRPAPIQVTGLGFGAWTTGLDTIDYQLSTRHHLQLSDCKYNSEKVVYLKNLVFWTIPESTEIIDKLTIVPPPVVSRDYITFGCGNQLFKINEDVIACWANILKQVPHSVLHLKTPHLDIPYYQKLMTDRFQQHGVISEQLVLMGSTNQLEHFRFYQNIDIALDPFPYTGGVSSCESLWMSRPLITLNTGTKTGANFLNHMKKYDWIAYDIEDYISKAVQLAQSPERIQQECETLRENFESSIICNQKSFILDIENAYRMMWRTWCGKKRL